LRLDCLFTVYCNVGDVVTFDEEIKKWENLF